MRSCSKGQIAWLSFQDTGKFLSITSKQKLSNKLSFCLLTIRYSNSVSTFFLNNLSYIAEHGWPEGNFCTGDDACITVVRYFPKYTDFHNYSWRSIC